MVRRKVDFTELDAGGPTAGYPGGEPAFSSGKNNDTDVLLEKIKNLLAENPDLPEDTRRLHALLLDSFPQGGLHMNLLIRAAEAGIPEELKKCKDAGEDLRARAPLMVKKLAGEFGMGSDLASWAVGAWAHSLGMGSSFTDPSRTNPGPRKSPNIKQKDDVVSWLEVALALVLSVLLIVMVVCLKGTASPVLVSEDHKTETAANATPSTTAKADADPFQATLQRLKRTLEILQRKSSTEALTEKNTKVQQTTGSVIKPASEIDLQRTREAQRLLNLLGYNAGIVDGRLGPQTSRAVRGFQRDNRLRIDGNISDTLISQLRKVNGEKRIVKAKPAAFLVPSPDPAQMTPPKSDIEIFYDMVQRERAEKLLRPKEKPVLPERFDYSGHGNGGEGNGGGGSGGNSGGQCSSEGGPSVGEW